MVALNFRKICPITPMHFIKIALNFNHQDDKDMVLELSNFRVQIVVILGFSDLEVESRYRYGIRI